MFHPRVIAWTLALVTLLVYLPVTRDGFLNLRRWGLRHGKIKCPKRVDWGGNQMGFHHLAREQLASGHLALAHGRL